MYCKGTLIRSLLCLLVVTFSPLISAQNAGDTFVQLFEWSWNDVAAECQAVLGPAGYRAVQVSPPQKSIAGSQWWTRYQPISYEILGRSGSRSEFAEMVKLCKASGVDVYVDVVINHMAAWDRYFPEVPYDEQDFHECQGPIDFSDLWSIQNCDLLGLNDLKTESDYVQQKIIDYLNELVNLGSAGFHIGNAQHIPASDIEVIASKLNDTVEGKRPFIFQEVNAQGPVTAEEYMHIGAVTEFKFSHALGFLFKGQGPLFALKKVGVNDDWLDSKHAISFVSNHISQRFNTENVITQLDGEDSLRLANVFMLAWPYAYPRIMSGYDWENQNDGPPEMCASMCVDGWLCEHRDMATRNMVQFRQTAGDSLVKHWWDNGFNQVAFSREKTAFLAMNGDPGGVMDQRLQTGLEPGLYCNVVSGNFTEGKCTGQTVEVDKQGYAQVTLRGNTALALHSKARLDSATCNYPSMFVRGSFNNWQAQAMQCHAGVWQARVYFKQEDSDKLFKLDAYANWRKYWGDNNLDAFVDAYGDKIPVIASGEYLISFDDHSGEYQAVQLTTESERQVSVEFTCKDAETYPGQSVYVTGDSQALGQWNPANAIKLSSRNKLDWSAKLSLPQDQFIEWKCIKREDDDPFRGLQWQAGDNPIFYSNKDRQISVSF